jgi:uncharacterized protein
MGLTFEWNETKALENLRKLGISFGEALTIFGDPSSLTVDDLLHAIEEDRFITIGLSDRGKILVVVHTEKGDYIRITSTRLATPREVRIYGEGTEQ